MGTHTRLIERPITFGYDFRMRCDGCGQSSTLSGADYLRLNVETGAHMDCEHCDSSIHFGPLVADIRDPEDPALDDALLNQLSWYHTSTYPDWPSVDYERDLRSQFDSGTAHVLMSNPERYLRGQLDNALHLGTYEAAIENMYRRIRDQADQRSEFFLHRIRVDIGKGKVNVGYRDENDEPAAQISITELVSKGLDAVRYLNVWEASGCISLAVRADVIREVQTIHVRKATHSNPPRLDRFKGLVADLRMREDEAVDSDEQRTFRGYALMRELEEALAAHLLPGVNPAVSEEFISAVRAIGRRADTDDFDDFVSEFGSHSVLLTQPERVLRLLDQVIPRPLPGLGTGGDPA